MKERDFDLIFCLLKRRGGEGECNPFLVWFSKIE